MKKLILVIPARYKSSRFPGKPLFMFNNKSMIQMVWENCINAIDPKYVYVATDDKRIKDHCMKKNIQVIMTSKNCKTGTDRVYEVSKKIKAELYINVQGDEPMLQSKKIKKFIKFAKSKKKYVVNAKTDLKNSSDLNNTNIPKCICDKNNFLIYMSRLPIPGSKKKTNYKTKKQVCMYSFPQKKLKKFGLQKTKTPIESVEDIEILRFLELGEKIKMINVTKGTLAVDTLGDAKKVLKLIN